MKWKKLNESVNDAAEALAEVEEPVKIKEVDEITPESNGFGSLGSDAQFLIDEYIGDMARKNYRNGHIPEDEEQAIRDALACVYVEFEYWAPEDEDYEAGYDDGKALFIIDKDDGSLCNVDFFECVYPNEVRDFVENEAYNWIGVEKGINCCPC